MVPTVARNILKVFGTFNRLILRHNDNRFVLGIVQICHLEDGPCVRYLCDLGGLLLLIELYDLIE
jgi:hypothetical protein